MRDHRIFLIFILILASILYLPGCGPQLEQAIKVRLKAPEQPPAPEVLIPPPPENQLLSLPREELFKEPDSIVYSQINSPVTVDLDGDGTTETVSYELSQEDLTSGAGIYLSAGKARVSEGGNNFRIDIVDIDKLDNVLEIAVGDEIGSDEYMTRLYKYTGEKLIRIGTVGGILETVTETDSTSSHPRRLRIPGYGSVWGIERGRVLHTWFYKQQYQLNPLHQLARISSELVEMNQPVTVLRGINLVNERYSAASSVTLNPGEPAMLLATDNKEWVAVQNSEGKIGWFRVTDFWFIDGVPATEYFDGLMIAE